MNFSVPLLFHLAYACIKNAYGCLNSPYTTLRKLAYERETAFHVVYLWLLALGYFAFASYVRIGTDSPFLLTFKFNLLISAGAAGFLSMVVLLYFLGKLVGGSGDMKTVMILWSYTLLPTVFWFLITSFMYILFPPPRTLSVAGKLFSVVFVAFSIAMLIWKIILYYLTLRFGMKLDLFRIGIISTVVIFFITIYSILMYKFGIFRVPFI